MVLIPWKRWVNRTIWDWIQVEVTTRCNASCSYCPRTLAGKNWPQRDLNMQLFRRLLPHLAKARHVHLQGWGEPLLHPELFQMAKLSREAGCRVGTTTNGALMDLEMARRMVRAGFHVVAFSMAGTGPENDRIRKGAPLERVLHAMRLVARARAEAGSDVPEIHVAYMLLASAWEEFFRLPEILDEIPVSQVVVSTLDCVLEKTLEGELMPHGDKALLSCLAQVSKELALKGTLLHHHLGDVAGGGFHPCTENVLRALVVGAQGDVGPCVYTNMSLPGVSQWRKGEKRPLHRLSFGNLAQKSLMEIWEDPAYMRFRDSFFKGSWEPSCVDCPKRCGL